MVKYREFLGVFDFTVGICFFLDFVVFSVGVVGGRRIAWFFGTVFGFVEIELLLFRLVVF